MNIRSRGRILDSTRTDSLGYGTTAYASILATLKNLDISLDDYFVDLGCGKGRAICCAARYKMREAIGIEYDDTLAEIARNNAKRFLWKRSPITIITCNVEDYNYDRGSKFYMFAPFKDSVLKIVLKKLRLSLKNNPREIKLVYINTTPESSLWNTDFLDLYDEWQVREDILLDHRVTFWKSK